MRPAWAVALFLAGLAPAVCAQPGPLPSDSVYHVDPFMADQDGTSQSFAAGRGDVRIVSMFYSSCPNVCPLLVESIKLTERALTEDQRTQLRVTLISLDPERDTSAKLKDFAAQRSIDLHRWSLVRPDKADVRKLAAVLGVQYRQLSSGEFNHSTNLILLDREGRVLARTARLGEVDPGLLARLRTALP
jgi:protein SCO1